MSIAHITDPVASRGNHGPRVSASRASVSQARASKAHSIPIHVPSTTFVLQVKDPDLIVRTRRRGGHSSAIFTALLGIGITAIAFGYFPQVGIFWDQLNLSIQSHNDDIVRWIIAAAIAARPVLLAIAIFFIFYRIVRWIAAASKPVGPTA